MQNKTVILLDTHHKYLIYWQDFEWFTTMEVNALIVYSFSYVRLFPPYD
jgi:hypothetical protein